MALSHEEMSEILLRRERDRFRSENPFVEDDCGDEGWELTAEDEAILDRAWAERAAREGGRGRKNEVMSNEDTLRFFGLADE